MNDKTETLMEKDGKWIPVEGIPYYPSLREKIGHFFGKHYFYEADKCLLCGLPK